MHRRGDSACLLALSVLVLLIGGALPSASAAQRPSAQDAIAIPEFRKSAQVFPPNDRTWTAALGDLDGDGDLDLVFATIHTPSQVLLNDGHGRFAPSGQTFPNRLHGLAIGDLDGDGDQDLFFTPLENGTPAIYLNDGHARFEPVGPRLERNEIVRLVDIERDGDLDAYLGYSNALYVNDGRGRFSRSDRSMPDRAFFADLNGDGYADVMQGQAGRGFGVFLNDRTGRFAEHSFLPWPALADARIGFADLDNDGDQDAVFVDATDTQQNPSGVLLNDGHGRFRSSGQRLPAIPFGHVATGDLNGDGYVDVILQGRDVPAQVWLNRGNGQFTDSGIRLEGANWNGCVVADIDGDGDQDVLLINTLGGNHGIWLNQLSEHAR